MTQEARAAPATARLRNQESKLGEMNFRNKQIRAGEMKREGKYEMH